jgi:hypothetical protein
MDNQELTLLDCALSDLGKMDYGFARAKLPRSQHSLLVVRLKGAASNDRSERGVFDYASAVIMAGLEAWKPTTLILDLRELTYAWGDEMVNVLGAADHWYQAVYPLQAAFGGENTPKHFPLAVVVSDANRDGLRSLVSDYMNKDPSLLLFESLEKAARALDDRMKNVLLA